MPQKKEKFYTPLTRQQRIGLLLVLLLIALVIVWQLLPLWVHPLSDADDIALQKKWNTFKEQHLTDAPATGQHSRALPRSATAALHSFDPNTVRGETLLAFGIPAHTVQTLLNFRSHGGRFYQAADLKKIYGLTQAAYDKLAPFVQIKAAAGTADRQPNVPPAAPTPQAEPLTFRLAPSSQEININEADAAAWQQLPGIGRVLSERIIRFREALGGFYSVDQIKEVYALPDSVFRAVSSRLSVGKPAITQININQATAQRLAAHPYLTEREAAAIVNVRRQIKKFADIRQLATRHLINAEKYRKIAPYLTTN